MRYVMNSAAIPAGAFGSYTYEPMSWDALRDWLDAGSAESRVGYQETADLIERRTGHRLPLCRDATPLAPGDEAAVVRLRYRVADPATKGAASGASDDAWEVGLLRRAA